MVTFMAGSERSRGVFLRFAIVFLALLATAAAANNTPNISGSWSGTFNAYPPPPATPSGSGDSGPITVTITQINAVNFSGFLTVPGSSCLAGGGAIAGTIHGNTIRFGNIAIAGGIGPNAITFTGTVDSPSQMSGTYAVQPPCAVDGGIWNLALSSPLAAICPDCVHAVDGSVTVNTVPLWSATTPGTLMDSWMTQDSAGIFHIGSYLQFGGTNGGLMSSGPNSGLSGRDTNITGANIGVFGEADGDNGAGVFGFAPACTAAAPCTPGPGNPNAGFTAGVRGVASGTNGYGVRGFNGSATGTTHGIEGRVSSPDGKGAEGWNTNAGTTGNPIGVYGRTLNAKGIGIKGEATTNAALADNSTTGVLGSGKTGVSGFASVADQGVGVWGVNFGTTGWARGVLAQTFSPAGEAASVEAPNGGNLIVGRGSNYATVFRVGNDGGVHANGGLFPSGADFAESMRVEGASEDYESGDVLVIDRNNSRQLTLAAQPYSPLVAGIYSTKPGVLASPGGLAKVDTGKEVPLAVVGIVPCKVSAENGAVRVGDLLVTSSMPGYAMKGSDRGRMLGAIVGKALEPLRDGTGIIQVLVTLQ